MGDGLKRARAAAQATSQPRTLPEPGQVWADNDPRSAGRTLRVDRIEEGKAICTVLTNSDLTAEQVSGRLPQPRDMRGKTTRISLSRFRPTSTGYRLVKDHD